jgi:hypothetical protein
MTFEVVPATILVTFTTMCSVSLDAITGPTRVETKPNGLDEVMCMANAAETGDSLPSTACGGTVSRPSSNM